MPSMDPSLTAKRPEVHKKQVTWLELFFDLIFALALAMSVMPLEDINDFSAKTWYSFGQFLLMYIFLIMFWYKHMVLINRFDHNSFLTTIMTLFIGFLVIAFTQFIRIWRLDAELGSFLATITISLLMISIAGLYFMFTLKFIRGGENEKRWARASAKYMFFTSIGFFAALLATPSWRPYIFIIVFLYFNRYPFANWINPKAPNTLPAELQNVPPEQPMHKAERIGLFSLLIYGLLLVLAAGPLVEIDNITSVQAILDPIIMFGKVFLFISVIWYLHYRLFEMIGPKGHQFTTLTFVTLALIVADTQFIRIIFVHPSENLYIFFAITTGLIFSVLATAFWNVRTMAAIPMSDTLLTTFKQWAYLLYASATAFFVSPLFINTGFTTTIWEVVMLVVSIALLIERRLNISYYMGTVVKKNVKFFDNQTVSGLTFMVIGVITFFVLTALLRKPIASIWVVAWVVPFVAGFFIILNHWLHNRIKPN
jgi:low temperature requirement protein LtrA